MAMNFEETVKQLTEFLKTEAKTETVVGQPFQLGEFTCVPVIRFGLGLGYGGGEGKGSQQNKGNGEGTGGGAGGGLGLDPIGFLVTRGDHISFIPTHNSKGLSAAFEKLPEALGKIFDKKKEQRPEASL